MVYLCCCCLLLVSSLSENGHQYQECYNVLVRYQFETHHQSSKKRRSKTDKDPSKEGTSVRASLRVRNDPTMTPFPCFSTRGEKDKKKTATMATESVLPQQTVFATGLSPLQYFTAAIPAGKQTRRLFLWRRPVGLSERWWAGPRPCVWDGQSRGNLGRETLSRTNHTFTGGYR